MSDQIRFMEVDDLQRMEEDEREYEAQGRMHGSWIGVLEQQFRDGDSDAAILTLLTCRPAGRELPCWLVEWLADGFSAWRDCEADTLNKAFDIKPSDRPKSARRRQQISRRRDAGDIFILNEVFGFTVSDAAERVWLRNKKKGWDSPSSESLAEQYFKKWRDEMPDEKKARLREGFGHDKLKESYLSIFPDPRR